MPLTSVIIPFYNRLNWVKQSIESVFWQTMKEYELILIDDGSTENLSILHDILKNPNVVYIKQSNRGASAARNKGIEVATSEFIAFLDSDDLFQPTKLETQINYMQRYPSISLSHTSYDRIDQEGNFLETIQSGLFTGQVYPEIYLFCPIATPTVVLRREFIVINNLFFDEGISIAEDILFWTKIAKKSEILGIDKPLSSVRINGMNTAVDKKKQIIGYQNIISGIRKDDDLSPTKHEEYISKSLMKISSLYREEGDKINSKKYSLLVKDESFLIWLKYELKNVFYNISKNFPYPLYWLLRTLWRKII